MISYLYSTVPCADIIHALLLLNVFILPYHVLVWHIQRSLKIDHNGIEKMLGPLLGRCEWYAFERHNSRVYTLRVIVLDATLFLGNSFVTLLFLILFCRNNLVLCLLDDLVVIF